MSPSDRSAFSAPLRRQVRRRADAGVAGADDFLSARTREELLSRLPLTNIRPHRILDAGAATGSASAELARRYRGCRVVSLDVSTARLAAARGGHGRFARRDEVAGDAARLPFRDRVFDLVFANLLLPWLGDPGPMLAETARVLRPEGLFTFSSLGPDSFRELREAWATVDDGEHVPTFLDMHDLGDALVRAGLRDPVLDVERITVTYAEPAALWRDLTAAGARNTLAGRNRGLATPARFRRLAEAWGRSRRDDGRLPLTLELVYGHCWGGSGLPGADAGGEVRISASRIMRRR
jgi:malonyl-CoA O-methyltransferase